MKNKKILVFTFLSLGCLLSSLFLFHKIHNSRRENELRFKTVHARIDVINEKAGYLLAVGNSIELSKILQNLFFENLLLTIDVYSKNNVLVFTRDRSQYFLSKACHSKSILYDGSRVGVTEFCIKDNSMPHSVFLLSCFLLMLFCYFFFKAYRDVKTKNEYVEFVSYLDGFEVKDESKIIFDSNNSYLKNIIVKFNKINDKAKLTNSLKLKMKIKETKLSIARQVAHDIESPITALNYVLERNLSAMTEDDRMIISHAISRVKSISDNLGSLNQNLPEVKNRIVDIESIVTSIVTEKKEEFHKIKNIKIHLRDMIEPCLYIHVDPNVLKRILSNLINNAYEAMRKISGEIILSITSNKEEVRLSIKDEGVGMGKEILNKIGTKGYSNKKNGSGLGFSHAISSLKLWGGMIDINSKLNEGTTVDIVFPRFYGSNSD